MKLLRILFCLQFFVMNIAFIRAQESVYENLNKVASQYFSNRKYDSASLAYDKLLIYVKREGDLEKVGSVVLDYVLNLYYQKEYDQMIALLQNTFHEYAQLQDESVGVKMMGYMALAYGKREDYLNSYNAYLQALRMHGDKKDEDLANFYTSLSFLCNKRGDFRKSISFAEEAIKIRKELGDVTLDSYMSIAKAHKHLNNFEQSYENYLKAIRESEKISRKKYERTLWTVENDIGLIFYNMGQYDSALIYLNHPKFEKEYVPSLSSKKINLSNLAMVYDAKGMHETALLYLRKAFDVFAKQGKKKSTRSYAKTCTSLARTFLHLHQYDSALHYSHLGIVNHLPFFDTDDLYAIPDLTFTNSEDALRFSLHRKAKAFLGLALQTKSPKDQEMPLR